MKMIDVLFSKGFIIILCLINIFVIMVTSHGSRVMEGQCKYLYFL